MHLEQGQRQWDRIRFGTLHHQYRLNQASLECLDPAVCAEQLQRVSLLPEHLFSQSAHPGCPPSSAPSQPAVMPCR